MRAGVPIAALAAAACQRAPAPPPRPGPDGLIAALATARAVDAMAVPGAAWPRLTSAPYRGAHAAYAAGYATAIAPVRAALAAGRARVARPHYADDPALAAALRRERLALPVAAPAWVVAVDGRDLPAVFVWDGAAWRCLAGVDALTRGAIAGFDPACADAYARAAAGRCLDASAPAAVAALAGDAPAVAIACRRLRALAEAGGCEDRGSVAPAAHP